MIKSNLMIKMIKLSSTNLGLKLAAGILTHANMETHVAKNVIVFQRDSMRNFINN